ncbi:MAG: sigma 54-interacting transcriptional regulator [Deltaproteobacteria bacterium]|jgi:TyrR family helix-turn-helix protein|nr:sigma 54-interacting transcriptional regulator [Deltaproteobacteria bacterium]
MDAYAQICDFLKNPDKALFFDNPFLGITLCNEKGTVVYVNKTHSRITGTSDWVGKNFYDLVRSGYVSESSTMKIIETGKEVFMEQRLGNNKSFLVHGYPIFDDDNTLRYALSYLLDVSQMQNMKDELDQVRRKMDRLQSMDENRIVFQSKKMREIVDRAQAIANSDATVLITGESGVGKEAIASMIHMCSDRKDNPFIKINCNAIPLSLLESELFGYEPGTFTGGNRQGRSGLLERADTGTLFFDEIGDMPPELQVKLLRVLQEREIRRLGGFRDIKIDVRVIAATNADLPTLIRHKKFRQDLYYRLNVIPIVLPPLRERREDIPGLISHFVGIFNEKYRKTKEFRPGAMEALARMPFEGNIRQLRNMVERLFLLSPGDAVEESDVTGIAAPENAIKKTSGPESRSLKTTLKNQERELLRTLYQQYASSYKIASLLGVNQSTIWRKLKKYGIISQSSIAQERS